MAGAITAPASVSTRRQRAARWLRSPDGICIGILVLVPIALFAIPAALGSPALQGDNLIQNYPLRVFSGRLLAEGHLPLWDPYIWSGNPLLGGLNAGSFYPLTLLFVGLPSLLAWTINMIVPYVAAGVGLYLVMRQFSVRPSASLLAGLVYGFAGAMSGQMVHLPIIQGMGWIPWMVLAQLRLSWSILGVAPDGVAPAATRSSPWRWIALLAASLGLILLTGEPRAMAETEIVATFLVVWLTLRRYPVPVSWQRRVRYVGASILAAGWAAALSAAQLLPGLSFITASTRGTTSYAFFGTGSLHPQWSVLLLVPDIFGGNGILGQPQFFNSYNLPEVTGYLGLVPLAAAFALVPSLFGRRRDRRASDYLPWFVLGVIGLFLSWGSFTFFGQVAFHIPFFSSTRLQSRSLGIVDLALAVLFGFWLERALSGNDAIVGLRGRRRWLTAAPVAAAGLLCLVAIAIPGPLERAFISGVGEPSSSQTRGLTPWLLAQLVIVIGALVLIFGRAQLSAKWWRGLAYGVVVADIVLFSVATQTSFVPAGLTIAPSAQVSASVFGTTGRYAIYDPTYQNLERLTEIGQTDLNVLTRQNSVQGYGSIVSGTYGNVTGSHPRDVLSPCALAQGVFTPLRLHVLLTASLDLAPPLPRTPPASYPPPPPCPGAPLPGTSTERTWYFGQLLSLDAASLVSSAPASDPHGRHVAAPRVGVLRVDGRVAWPSVTVSATAAGWHVHFASVEDAVGLVVRGPVRQISDNSVVDALDGKGYLLNGSAQDALGITSWHYRTLVDGFVTFAHPDVLPPVWLQRSPTGAHVRQISTTDWGVETDRVSSPVPVTVVRSEAYLSGWHVQAVPVHGGATRTLAVRADGLVQSVRVPAGDWTLTFLYRAKGLTPGLVSTALALLVLVAFGVIALVRRRRIASTALARDDR